jgi:hypothetical protein
MKAVIALAIVLFATAGHAGNLWDHNGSVVSLEANGATRKFYYRTPRPGLPATSGALLFSGRKEGDRYSGTAYVFSPKCGARGYPVSGPVAGDQRTVTLYGQAPHVDSNCRVTSHRDDMLVFTYQDVDSASSNQIAMTIGKDASTFHYEYSGRTIYVDPTAEVGTDHDWFLFEDLVKADPRFKLQILFGRTAGIANAFAAIYRGSVADLYGRRIIVTDPGWLGGHDHSPSRFVVFAHELGHHICGHQGTYDNDRARNWGQELEADQISGVALRTWVKWGHGSIDDAIAAAYLLYSNNTGGTASHPPQAQRIAAITEGYRTGISPCFGRNVSLPTDLSEEQQKQIERESKQFFRTMARLNGADMRWSFKHWTLGEISIRSAIDGNTIRMVIDKPSAQYESAGARRGSVFFEGTSDDGRSEGNFYHYTAGCRPIPYKITSIAYVNPVLILVAKPPGEIKNCEVVNYYNDTAHIIKAEKP